MERFEQHGLFNRLGQEVDGPGPHRPDRQGDIAIAGQHDDRHVDADIGQGDLNLKPAQARHLHVQDDAADLGLRRDGHKRRPRRIGLDAEARGAEHEADRPLDRLLVVDDMNDTLVPHGPPQAN